MSFRERVYIFQTQKAAALFLRQNANLYTGDRPISDFRNVYFNTDPLPSTTFPLAWECFVSLDMARLALMSVEPELQPAFPMDGLPQDVLQAAFTGGPGRGPRAPLHGPRSAVLRLRVNNNREVRRLSAHGQQQVAEVTRKVLAISANQERYINQGWHYDTATNVWSIPASKYASFVALLEEDGGDFPGGHIITLSDGILLDQIVGIIGGPSGRIITKADTQQILNQIAVQLQLNGQAKWGIQCRLALSESEQHRLQTEIDELKRSLVIQRNRLASAQVLPRSEISRPGVQVGIQDFEGMIKLKNKQLMFLASRRAHISSIEEIDEKIKELAQKILRAHAQISACEAEIKRELEYAKRVQECADAFGFDIREFRLDIEDLEVMVASFMSPNCGAAANQEISAVAENLATLQLLSLSILEPEVQALKRIPKKKLMEDLTALATDNYRARLYNRTGGVMALTRRATHRARGALGDLMSTFAKAPPGNVMGLGHLASAGTRKIKNSLKGALGSVRNSLSEFFRPSAAQLNEYSRPSASSVALNRAMGASAPAPLHEVQLPLLMRSPQVRRSLSRLPGLAYLDALASGYGVDARRWQNGVRPPGLRGDGGRVEDQTPSHLTPWQGPAAGPLAAEAVEEYAMPGGLASAGSGESGFFPLHLAGNSALRNPMRFPMPMHNGQASATGSRKSGKGRAYTALMNRLAAAHGNQTEKRKNPASVKTNAFGVKRSRSMYAKNVSGPG